MMITSMGPIMTSIRVEGTGMGGNLRAAWVGVYLFMILANIICVSDFC